MLKNVLRLCVALGVCAAFSNKNQQQHPSKWAVNILQDKVSVSALKDIEPGFDLSDEDIKKLKLWPDGLVPYYIDTVSFDKVLRDRIRNYLEVTSGLSGLQFLELPSPPLDSTTRWVFFINRRGLLNCADHSITNMTNEGVQKVLLGYHCIVDNGELATVVLMIAGVPAQHNSPYRDKYITVNMNKIIPGKRYLYQKLKNTDWLFHDLEYDFTSAGHFHFHKHTIDGHATITPLKPVDILVGEVDGFSYADILKIRMLYNYISKKPQTKNADCKKLFKRGPNLAKNRGSQKYEQGEPRRIPYQYSGSAPGDEDNAANNDAGTDNDAEASNDGEAGNDSDNGGGDNNDGQNGDYVQNGNADNNFGDSGGNMDGNDNREDGQVDGRMKLKSDNPLNALSDYETDEEKKLKSKRHD